MNTPMGTLWKVVGTLVLSMALSACGGGGDGGGGSTPAAAPHVGVSGAVQAPGGQVAMSREATIWQQMLGVWLSEAMAGVSGVSPVSDGTPVQLVRVNNVGNVIATLASTTVSGGRYSFNLTSLGLSFSNNLVVQIINQGTGAQMRAFVVGSTVNLDPISEASVRLVFDQILLTPGTTLSQFTVTELRDIAGAVNQLATVKQATAGLNIETTVTSIKNLVVAEPGVSSFIAAAAGAGQTTEGPGDIGNYFPLRLGQTWQFQGTHSKTGLPTVDFSNPMTVKGPILVGTVTTTILADSNPLNTPLNAGSEEEDYLLKDSRGILNYGNNDPSDTLSHNLVPYREAVFPLNLEVTSEVVNRKGVNFGKDIDLPPDGKNETADVLSQVTVEKFEDVTVPKGTFTNTAKVVQKTTITVFSSAGFGSATVVGTQTMWFAPGVGPVKRIILVQSQDTQSTESTNEELLDYYFKSFGPALSYSSNGSNFMQTAIGDLNGDGRNDVVHTAENPRTIPMFYQDAQGKLSPFIPLNVSSSMTALHRIAVGDLNNDGKTDLVVTGACVSCGPGTQGRVLIYYQHPTNGTLLSGQLRPISADFAASAAIGDINADGRKDLVVINLLGSLSIYYQLPNGTLGSEVIYDKIHGDLTVEVHIADMDNDGDQDIVVQDFVTSQGQFSVIKQDSSVTPGVLSNTPETYAVAGGFRSFALGDVNADGRNDVVVSDYANSTLWVFLQNSAGTLSAPLAIPPTAGGLPVGIEIADINGDGLNDLLSDTGSNVLVYQQAPDHSFKSPIPYNYQSQYIGGGGFYLHLAVGDVTGDNKPDAVVSHDQIGLFVLPNTTP